MKKLIVYGMLLAAVSSAHVSWAAQKINSKSNEINLEAVYSVSLTRIKGEDKNILIKYCSYSLNINAVKAFPVNSIIEPCKVIGKTTVEAIAWLNPNARRNGAVALLASEAVFIAGILAWGTVAVGSSSVVMTAGGANLQASVSAVGTTAAMSAVSMAFIEGLNPMHHLERAEFEEVAREIIDVDFSSANLNEGYEYSVGRAFDLKKDADKFARALLDMAKDYKIWHARQSGYRAPSWTLR